MTVPETTPAIVAQLAYNYGGKVWAARFYDDKDKDGRPCYLLVIESGGRSTVAGTFYRGKAAAKFARDKADERMRGYTATVDTLHLLQTREPGSVVPSCYRPTGAEGDEAAGGGMGREECLSCVYRSRCGPERAPAPSAPHLEDELTVAERQKKLRAYVAAHWPEGDA